MESQQFNHNDLAHHFLSPRIHMNKKLEFRLELRIEPLLLDIELWSLHWHLNNKTSIFILHFFIRVLQGLKIQLLIVKNKYVDEHYLFIWKEERVSPIHWFTLQMAAMAKLCQIKAKTPELLFHISHIVAGGQAFETFSPAFSDELAGSWNRLRVAGTQTDTHMWG